MTNQALIQSAKDTWKNAHALQEQAKIGGASMARSWLALDPLVRQRVHDHVSMGTPIPLDIIKSYRRHYTKTQTSKFHQPTATKPKPKQTKPKQTPKQTKETTPNKDIIITINQPKISQAIRLQQEFIKAFKQLELSPDEVKLVNTILAITMNYAKPKQKTESWNRTMRWE